IVAHAGDVTGIADADRGDGVAIIAETARELLCEMHGIAHAATIAAAYDLGALLQAVAHERSSLLHRIDVGLVRQETLKHFGCFNKVCSGPVGAHRSKDASKRIASAIAP